MPLPRRYQLYSSSNLDVTGYAPRSCVHAFHSLKHSNSMSPTKEHSYKYIFFPSRERTLPSDRSRYLREASNGSGTVCVSRRSCCRCLWCRRPLLVLPGYQGVRATVIGLDSTAAASTTAPLLWSPVDHCGTEICVLLLSLLVLLLLWNPV